MHCEARSALRQGRAEADDSRERGRSEKDGEHVSLRPPAAVSGKRGRIVRCAIELRDYPRLVGGSGVMLGASGDRRCAGVPIGCACMSAAAGMRQGGREEREERRGGAHGGTPERRGREGLRALTRRALSTV
eukprot:scaffold82230_cov37-Tisochrysis_lutea.AAC.3